MSSTLDLAIRLKDQASSNFNKVSSSVDNLNNRLDAARDKMNRFSDGMAKTGTKMSAFVTAPILGLGGAMLKAAADQEQLDVAFKTMLGSAEKAKKLMEELKTFSAETPFEMPEVVSAGRQLLAYGIEAEKVQGTLRMLGDVAAGTGSSIGDLAYLFGTAKAQGRLFATDINQFAGRGIPIFKALAETMGVAENQVRELVSEGKVGFDEMQAAFEYMTRQGSQFGGMMENQSKTLGGIWSTLKDNLTITLTDIGLKLVDTFDIREKAAGALEFVNELRGQILGFIDLNPELVKQGAIWLGIAASIGPLLLALSGVLKFATAIFPAIKFLASAFALLTSPIGIVVVGLSALIALDVGGLGTKLKNLGKSIIDFGKDIINSSDPMQEMKSKFDDFKKTISNTASSIRTSLNNIPVIGPKIENIVKAFDKLDFSNIKTDSLSSFITSLKTEIDKIPVVGPTIDAIVSAIQKLGTMEVPDVSETFNSLVASLTTAFDSVRDSIDGIPVVGPKIDEFISSFQKLDGLSFESFTTALDGINKSILSMATRASIGSLAFLSFFSSVGENVGTFIEKVSSIEQVKTTIDNVKSSVSDLVTGFGNLFSDEAFKSEVFENLKTTFQELIPVLTLVSGIIGGVLIAAINLFTGLLKGVPQIVKGVISQITESFRLISTVFGEVASLILAVIQGDWKGAWQAAKNIYQGFYNYFKQTAENIKSVVSGIVESIGGAISNIVKLFSFDTTGFDTTVSNLSTAIKNFKFPEFEWPELPVLSDLSWPELPVLSDLSWPTLPDLTTLSWPKLPTWTWPAIQTSLFQGWPPILTSLFQGWPSIPRPTWSFPHIPKPGWVTTLENIWNSRPGFLGGGNAMGTTYYPGGQTNISERGAETVILPSGTQILNSRETKQLRTSGAAVGAGGVVLNFYGPVDSMARVNQIVDTVMNEINRRERV